MLIDKYSFKEQADLVWEFLCSIPVDMMMKFLPWLSFSISSDEHQDMINCLSKILPKEKLLKQVMFLFMQDSFVFKSRFIQLKLLLYYINIYIYTLFVITGHIHLDRRQRYGQHWAKSC